VNNADNNAIIPARPGGEPARLREGNGTLALATGPRGRAAADGMGIDFAWLAGAILRNWWLIGLVVVAASGIAVAVLKSLPDHYTAYTEVIVERDETEFGNLREGLDFGPTGISPAEMETHLRLLGSDNIARAVIERLQLEPSTSQAGLGEDVQGWLAAFVNALTRRFEALAGNVFPSEAGQPAISATGSVTTERSDRAVAADMLEEFRTNLAIYRDPLAHVISIAYRDESPVLAATVSNEIAAVFLQELVGSQRALLNQTADYLRERVEAVGAELDALERAANKYQTEQALLEVQGSSGAELRFVELSRELSLAEADLARAAARAAQLRGGIDVMSESGESPVITDLRAQEAELNRRVAELSTLYGERHPTMINARAELADIQRSLTQEQQRLVQQINTERTVAQARVDDLREQLGELEEQLGRNTTAQVQLNQFES
jgi:uncharacterized protein involved in exopolysaccharide biosynthesis